MSGRQDLSVAASDCTEVERVVVGLLHGHIRLERKAALNRRHRNTCWSVGCADVHGIGLLDDGVEVVLRERHVCDGLLHRIWQLALPDPDYNFMTAATI